MGFAVPLSGFSVSLLPDEKGKDRNDSGLKVGASVPNEEIDGYH